MIYFTPNKFIAGRLPLLHNGPGCCNLLQLAANILTHYGNAGLAGQSNHLIWAEKWT